MEAVFATESQMPVTFDVFIDELDSGKQLVSRKETEESTPENRIAKINLLKQIRRLEERQTLLKEALYLLLLPSIRGVFLNTDELIESIRGLGFRLFDSGLGYFSINSCSLDVFREDPKINTIIHIEQSEATRMEQRLKLKSVFALTGPGWDLLDLPKETRIRKAIPAIVLEVARVKIHSNQPLDLLKVLILDAWSIGLH